MRTAKRERSESCISGVHLTQYDVPPADLESMVEELGSIAYTRGRSLSHESDDSWFDNESQDETDREDDLQDYRHLTIEADDESDDCETIYESTSDDAVRLSSRYVWTCAYIMCSRS
jgi:hypothetical protein